MCSLPQFLRLVLVTFAVSLSLISCSTTPERPSDTLRSSPNETSAAKGKSSHPVSVPGAFPTEGGYPMLAHLFDAGSNDTDGEIVKWEWNFGGPGGGGWQDYTSTHGDAWHTYSTPGMKVAHLRVTDNDGNKDTAFVKIRLSQDLNAPPVCIANGEPLSGYTPLLVCFSAEGSYDPDGDIVAWEWDFGEGAGFEDYTEASGIAEHAYTTPGEFTAILRISDDDGAASECPLALAVSEPPQWAHMWGRHSWDQAIDVSIDSDGNCYFCGFTYFYREGETHPLIMKYTSNGQFLWAKTWDAGVGANDTLRGITTGMEGSIFTFGRSKVLRDYWEPILLSYTPDGELNWALSWGTPLTDMGYELITTNSQSLYATGCTMYCTRARSGMFLVEFSPEGSVLRQKTIECARSQDAFAYAVKEAQDGSVYLAGGVFRVSGLYWDAALIKLTPDWELEWYRVWSTPGDDLFYSLCTDDDGAIYAGGSTDLFGSDKPEALVMSFDAAGEPLWMKAWCGEKTEEIQDIVSDPTGNIIAVGQSSSYLNLVPRALLLKYSPDGDLLEQRLWGSGAAGFGIDIGPDGYLVIGGRGSSGFMGEWLPVEGVESIPVGDWLDVDLAVFDITASTTSFHEGENVDLEGIIDEGAGNFEALAIKTRP